MSAQPPPPNVGHFLRSAALRRTTSGGQQAATTPPGASGPPAAAAGGGAVVLPTAGQVPGQLQGPSQGTHAYQQEVLSVTGEHAPAPVAATPDVEGLHVPKAPPTGSPPQAFHRGVGQHSPPTATTLGVKSPPQQGFMSPQAPAGPPPSSSALGLSGRRLSMERAADQDSSTSPSPGKPSLPGASAVVPSGNDDALSAPRNRTPPLGEGGPLLSPGTVGVAAGSARAAVRMSTSGSASASAAAGFAGLATSVNSVLAARQQEHHEDPIPGSDFLELQAQLEHSEQEEHSEAAAAAAAIAAVASVPTDVHAPGVGVVGGGRGQQGTHGASGDDMFLRFEEQLDGILDDDDPGHDDCASDSDAMSEPDSQCTGDGAPDPNGATNVFVRGLPKQFNEQALVALGARFGEVLRANVFVHPQRRECRGQGFVEFKQKSVAVQAIETLSGQTLENGTQPLQLSIAYDNARKKTGPVEPLVDKHTRSRVKLCNVPPNITHDDLVKLGSTFGTVCSCTMHEDTSRDRPVENQCFAYLVMTTESEAMELTRGVRGMLPWPSCVVPLSAREAPPGHTNGSRGRGRRGQRVIPSGGRGGSSSSAGTGGDSNGARAIGAGMRAALTGPNMMMSAPMSGFVPGGGYQMMNPMMAGGSHGGLALAPGTAVMSASVSSSNASQHMMTGSQNSGTGIVQASPTGLMQLDGSGRMVQTMQAVPGPQGQFANVVTLPPGAALPPGMVLAAAPTLQQNVGMMQGPGGQTVPIVQMIPGGGGVSQLPPQQQGMPHVASGQDLQQGLSGSGSGSGVGAAGLGQLRIPHPPVGGSQSPQSYSGSGNSGQLGGIRGSGGSGHVVLASPAPGSDFGSNSGSRGQHVSAAPMQRTVASAPLGESATLAAPPTQPQQQIGTAGAAPPQVQVLTPQQVEMLRLGQQPSALPQMGQMGQMGQPGFIIQPTAQAQPQAIPAPQQQQPPMMSEQQQLQMRHLQRFAPNAGNNAATAQVQQAPQTQPAQGMQVGPNGQPMYFMMPPQQQQ